MNCAKCQVEVAPESAVGGRWCWRCGEKEEERLGKLLDEAPWPSMSKPVAGESPPFISTDVPPDVMPGSTTTYADVRKEYEVESGHAPPPLKRKR